MFANLTGWHLLIIVGIVLLLFGAPKLPGLARSVGQSMRIFRGEVKTMKSEIQGDAGSDAGKVDASEVSASVIAPPQPIVSDAAADSTVKP